jgi:hypothetical protein
MPTGLDFTYSTPDPSQLMQGDIVRRSEEIEQILQSVHPHYFQKEDYRFFAVLTQSCDLVRREGKPCNSRYITIAAVRPAHLAIKREVSRQQFDRLETEFGFCSEARREKINQFIESLLNNNNPNYFFLYRQSNYGIYEDCCIFLPLSIALKADLHYDDLLKAKILQLSESFQHKLGFLVGTSYSRVGTRDWVPDLVDEEVFRRDIRTRVDAIDMIWLDTSTHRRVLKGLRDLPSAEQTPEAFQRIVEEIKRQKNVKRKETLDIIARALQDVKIPDETITRVRGRLDNNPAFRAALK